LDEYFCTIGKREKEDTLYKRFLNPNIHHPYMQEWVPQYTCPDMG